MFTFGNPLTTGCGRAKVHTRLHKDWPLLTGRMRPRLDRTSSAEHGGQSRSAVIQMPTQRTEDQSWAGAVRGESPRVPGAGRVYGAGGEAP